MARIHSAYSLAGRSGDDVHVSATSTGTANVQTVTAPATATGFFINVETNGLRFTLDGTTPDATNGLMLPTGAVPQFFPIGATIKFVSQAAGNAVAHVLWVE